MSYRLRAISTFASAFKALTTRLDVIYFDRLVMVHRYLIRIWSFLNFGFYSLSDEKQTRHKIIRQMNITTINRQLSTNSGCHRKSRKTRETIYGTEENPGTYTGTSVSVMTSPSLLVWPNGWQNHKTFTVVPQAVTKNGSETWVISYLKSVWMKYREKELQAGP
jgi:hypothetical protein